MSNKRKGNPWALLPIGVFLIIFLGAGILTGDFNTMPAIVGFLIALSIAFCQNRKVDFQRKLTIISRGIGEENIVTMCLIFLAAGAFPGTISAAGGVESTVNLGLSIMPPSIAVTGLFVIGCFISVSMGTSVGTITAMAPIGAGIAQETGLSVPLCLGAVVCGAMFGDNLSMISDTTIAAVRTQGCEMKDKFRENFLIVLPAAIVTALLFFFVARSQSGVLVLDKAAYGFQIARVIPYLVVLVGALIGVNVFVILIGGTILSAIVGISTGAFAFSELFQKMGEGVTSMYDITVISIIVAAIVALVREYGGIEFLLDVIRGKIRGARGGELGISLLVFLVDCCTANNTVAIVMAGPIAKEISDEYQISPKRSASLLDIFASVGQGVIPYGAQLLTAAGMAAVSPVEIMPFLYYPILMGISAIFFIMFRRRKV
ncbi:MAG TPA: Na+/H+ antiporter NhaC family protein [Candidatus Merdiplasma excrementigallinarum]|uniref:Na+/H+ antiporter NhaC family protein n=1 Tax=Candidatus Merdiplasma excrementigallinarum TaxID=2840864 RepID=A0A9D1NX34_9FIRM|nr:Na+/H+ antiporter NhaC family protein [Candidatus Merdiplasma excrementigallinarum]